MGKSDSPLGDLKEDVRDLLADCRNLLQRVAVLEDRVRLILWILGVVAVGTIGAIVTAIATAIAKRS